jgi:hypothetical protein
MMVVRGEVMAWIIYPGYKTREELGAERWVAEAEMLPPTWALMSDEEKEEFDPYEFPREVYEFRGPKAQAQATKKAKLLRRASAFGCARVQRQVVGWFVEEDRVAQWEDVGETEYVD